LLILGHFIAFFTLNYTNIKIKYISLFHFLVQKRRLLLFADVAVALLLQIKLSSCYHAVIMELKTMFTVIFVIYGIIAFFIIVLNLLIIIAVLKDPLKKLRNMFSYLLEHLCICNLLAGAVLMPLMIYTISTGKLLLPILVNSHSQSLLVLLRYSVAFLY